MRREHDGTLTRTLPEQPRQPRQPRHVRRIQRREGLIQQQRLPSPPPPQPRLINRPQRVTLAQRLVRNVAFRDTLLDAYERHCAVCGTPLELDDLTELEAAHIVAITEQGPDDPRNGLCLCVRHHWAFDHGVFTLTDELDIQTHLDGPDPHRELQEGDKIHTPDDQDQRPHPFYVKHHREKWG